MHRSDAFTCGPIHTREMFIACAISRTLTTHLVSKLLSLSGWMSDNRVSRADIPVQQLTKYDLVVNLTIAEALGSTSPRPSCCATSLGAHGAVADRCERAFDDVGVRRCFHQRRLRWRAQLSQGPEPSKRYFKRIGNHQLFILRRPQHCNVNRSRVAIHRDGSFAEPHVNGP